MVIGGGETAFWILFAVQVIPWNWIVVVVQFWFIDFTFRLAYMVTLSGPSKDNNKQSNSSENRLLAGNVGGDHVSNRLNMGAVSALASSATPVQ